MLSKDGADWWILCWKHDTYSNVKSNEYRMATFGKELFVSEQIMHTVVSKIRSISYKCIGSSDFTYQMWPSTNLKFAPWRQSFVALVPDDYADYAS